MLTNSKKWLMLGLYPAGMFILPFIVMFIIVIIRGLELAPILNGEDFYVLTVATVISYAVLMGVLLVISFPVFRTDFRKIKSWKNFGLQMLIGLVATFAMAALGGWLVTRTGETDVALNQYLVENALMAMPFLMIMTAVFFGPIVEEIIFRLVMMNVFPRLKPIHNIIFSSLIFGAMHVLVGGWIHIIPYFLMGCVFGYIYLKNDNIWHATVLHILHNGATVGLVFAAQRLLEVLPY